MKNILAVVITFFALLSLGSFAAEKDAAGCKDHPLIPRMKDYYIAACSRAAANFDVDKTSDNNPGTAHVAGNSTALIYNPQPELKSRPVEAQFRSDFESTIKKQGGSLLGTTPGQKWPVYRMVKDGKEFWIVLMIDAGYFTGSYAYRIVEK